MKTSIYLGVILSALLSVSANAASVTMGALTSNDDGTTETITDSLNNYEWLRWDVLADLTYQGTIDAITTGAYANQGWQFAHNAEALMFINALFDPDTHLCDVTDSIPNLGCGVTPDATSALLGDNYNSAYNYAFFLSDNGTGQDVGLLQSYTTGNLSNLFLQHNEWSDFSNADSYSPTGCCPPISWLLYRNASPVPIPAAFWLFGSALVGLLGVGRNRKQS